MGTENFQMFKLDLEKVEEPEIKLPTSVGSSKKQESSKKISTSALLTRPTPLPPKKPVHRSRSYRENRTQNNRLVPNWERSTSRLYIVTLLI